ncbi:hypothetical protein HZB07_01165 [Candidatus Saganbacteria bacterium]|nr:hypothetical protein [Candidatus Saganbacteria bacterium]
MKKIIVSLLLIASLLIVNYSSQPAFAIYAPRAMGMGSAFTAIADDAFAAYWNPAGFAINPGIDLSGSYQLTNRNNQIGDNVAALKACFEIGMDPFTWIFGIGAASLFAMEGAKYLADRGIVKKNWGRPGKKVSKEESLEETVKEEEEKQIAEGQEPQREPVSRRKMIKEGIKELGKGTIFVAKSAAKTALEAAVKSSHRHYYYHPYWYQADYYRPNYWDNRHDYDDEELTPAGKAQFALGLTVMSDKNSNLKQNSNWYTLSLASGWGEIAAIGGNFNIYDVTLTSLNAKGLGASFDIGGLLRFSDKLMFGLAAKELLTTDIKFDNHTTARYEMTINGGIAIKPLQELTLAADVHNLLGQNSKEPTMHYGVEVKPAYGIALRAGLSDTEQAKSNKTVGISFGIGQMIIDYAYLGGAYGRTQMISSSWKF